MSRSKILQRQFTVWTMLALVLGLTAALFMLFIPRTTANPSHNQAVSDNIITNVDVSTDRTYELDVLALDSRVYTDRGYTWTEIPGQYQGQWFIRTANSDKQVDDPAFLSFALEAPATVYVAYDNRLDVMPGWLSDGSWSLTGDLLRNSDDDRKVYAKDFPAGDVVLGGNASPSRENASNYNVIVVPGSDTGYPDPTDAPTDAPAPTDVPTDAPAPTDVPTDAPAPTDVPVDAPEPTEPPASGDLISDITTSTGKSYEVDALTVGGRVYIDRGYTWTEIPAQYEGQLFIRTANSDKQEDDRAFLRFLLNAPATVYVAYDNRLDVVPEWLSDGTWTLTGDLLRNSDDDRKLYAKDFPAGAAILGGNASPTRENASNYNVIVVPATDAPTEPTVPPVDPTAEPTDAPTEPTDAPVDPTAEPTVPPVDPTTEPTDAPVDPTAEPTEPAPTNTPEPEIPQNPQPLDQVGTQWSPYLEWSLENPNYDGNPYDLIASATFTHRDSGETRTTEMFYDGGDTWKFRFSGTRTGIWTFTTQSDDDDLAGKSGTVTINPNPDANAKGFITQLGNKWGRTGTDEAFVPQFLIYGDIDRNPGDTNGMINEFFNGHGFNGFHTTVYCRWFDISTPDCSRVNNADPDRQTFEHLEQLITKTYNAGGVVHIWMWGDSARDQNPRAAGWSLNGTEDQRIQRYIAARLGPIPGWSLGYGFDINEWANGNDIQRWHDFMHDKMGWDHYLGARYRKNQLGQWTEGLDYSSYEQHRPDYDKYVETIERRSGKPSFSEDRYRMRNEGRSKDYSPEDTRRGLWHSTMAGGVANIWGNLTGGGSHDDGSAPYPNADQLKTYGEFFEGRFVKDLERCNNLTDGACLQRPTNSDYLFYRENASSVRLNLSGMAGGQRAIAVDTKKPYAEIDLGTLDASDQTWDAPYESDWAIAVGF